VREPQNSFLSGGRLEHAAEKRAEATSEAQTNVGTSTEPNKRLYAGPGNTSFFSSLLELACQPALR
jgi:hypothetical protein